MRLTRSLLAVTASLAMIGTTAVSAQAGPGSADTSGYLAGEVAALAQRPDPALPPYAVPGSTAQRRAAWERLSPQQQQKKLAEFRDLVGSRVSSAVREQTRAQAAATAAPSWKDLINGQAKVANADPSAPRFTLGDAAKQGVRTGFGIMSDQDGDGLDQGFESQLANVFVPLYHVSAYERSGTGFARFYDRIPQDVSVNLPPTPPVVHTRVQPLGFGTDAGGRQVGILRIDYTTLWNRDDGFDMGGVCGAAVGLVSSIIGSDLLIGPHYVDNERSAVLVAAPIVGGWYNTDPNAYGAYSYYIAAHEWNPFGDHSAYYNYYPPVPANNHLNLAMSRWKHATYTFNPAGMPAIRSEWIALTYSTIDSLYFGYIIDYDSWLLYLFLADQAFYACMVETFVEQGGQYPGTRIDVGELTAPINASSFINDNGKGLRDKFAVPLW